MKNGYNNLSINEIEEANDALDPFSFEKYCGSCIFFNTDECPYYNKVCDITRWKIDIKCNNFFD